MYISSSTTHLVLLSNAMSTGLSLDVVLWVPVAVKDDDRVSRREVDTQTSGTSWQQETEILHIRKDTPINTASICLFAATYTTLGSICWHANSEVISLINQVSPYSCRQICWWPLSNYVNSTYVCVKHLMHKTWKPEEASSVVGMCELNWRQVNVSMNWPWTRWRHICSSSNSPTGERCHVINTGR